MGWRMLLWTSVPDVYTFPLLHPITSTSRPLWEPQVATLFPKFNLILNLNWRVSKCLACSPDKCTDKPISGQLVSWSCGRFQFQKRGENRNLDCRREYGMKTNCVSHLIWYYHPTVDQIRWLLALLWLYVVCAVTSEQQYQSQPWPVSSTACDGTTSSPTWSPPSNTCALRRTSWTWHLPARARHARHTRWSSLPAHPSSRTCLRLVGEMVIIKVFFSV